MTTTLDIEKIIAQKAAQQDITALRKSYNDQDEFLVLENYLPREIMEQWDEELQALKPHIHRNFIPKHKKGGSVPFDTVDELGPSMTAVYRSKALKELLHKVTESPVNECPDSDPHRCALYSYTEAGDHIGWHYDTSYYKDKRWTLLVGFQDDSSARLACRLCTKIKGREPVNLEMKVSPGTLVLFNGDRLYHCVTPIKENESRYMVSMQYVTRGDMSPFMRFVSNMKDSIAYFGLKEVFLGRKKKK